MPRPASRTLSLLDVDLPDLDPLKCLARLRQHHPVTPIFLIGAAADWPHRQAAFDRGADGVLEAGYDPALLAARIRAAVRRVEGHAQAAPAFGPLSVDTATCVARFDGTRLRLTRKEYEIVEMLVLRRGRLVSREAMLNQLYAWEDEPDARILNVYLSRIRSRVTAAGGDAGMLVTVWGLGYRLEHPETDDRGGGGLEHRGGPRTSPARSCGTAR